MRGKVQDQRDDEQYDRNDAQYLSRAGKRILRVVKFCPDSQEKAIAMIASMILQPQKKDASPNMNPTTEDVLWRGLSAAPYFSKTSSVFSAYSRRKFFANALSYPQTGHILLSFSSSAPQCSH